MRKCMLLILLVVLGLGLAAAEEPEFVFDTWNGYNILKTYRGAGGEVTVPESVDGYTVARVSMELFSGKKADVTGIVFPDTLQYLDDSVVNSMTALTHVELPEGLLVIGSNNFVYCPQITEVTLPSTVRFIGEGCFKSEGLSTLTFTGPVPLMDDGFSLWNPEDSTIYVPDDLYEEYLPYFSSSQRVEKSGRNAVIPQETEAAEEDFLFEEATGTITGYLGDAVWLKIPGQIRGTAVAAIGESAFNNSSLFAVEFPEGVKEIGESAFENSYQMRVASFPDSLVSIGNKAFNRTKMARVPSWGGVQVIGDEAFGGLALQMRTASFPDSLRSIGREAFPRLPADNIYFGSGLESIGSRAFAGAYATYLYFGNEMLPEMTVDAFEGVPLKDVDLPENARRSSADAAMAFFSQINPEITIWRANPTNVSYPVYAKEDYEVQADGTVVMVSYSGDQPELTTFWNVWVGDQKLPLTALGAGVFRGSQTLKRFRVNRSEFFTAIGEEAFADSTLEELDLFDTVTSLGAGALRNCSGLKELILPESLEFIGEGALDGLTGLTRIEVRCDASLLPERAFAGLRELKTVVIERGAVPEGLLEGSGTETLVLGEEVTSIGKRAFADTCLRSFTVPDIPIGAEAFAGVDWRELKAAAGASDEMVAALAEMVEAPWYAGISREGEASTFLTMPDEPNPDSDFLFDAETGSVELYVGKSTRVVIPGSIGGVEVRKISSQFSGNIRDFTGTEIINNQSSWIPVTSIVIPETVTEIGDSAFQYCQQLETVVCYAPLETTGRSTFQYDGSLKTVTFMNPVRAVDNYCFDHCASLETVYYSGTLDFIGEQAFAFSGLKSFIADAREIRAAAFMDCASLEEIHVRSAIEKMSLGAFGHCGSLNDICIETTNDEVFYGDDGYSGECGGDTYLTIPAEADDSQAKYILRKWHTSNFGPVPDEAHLLREACDTPGAPVLPESVGQVP